MGSKLDNPERNFAVTPFRSKASVLIRERPIPPYTPDSSATSPQSGRCCVQSCCNMSGDCRRGDWSNSLLFNYFKIYKCLASREHFKDCVWTVSQLTRGQLFDGSAFSNCAKNATHLNSVRFSRLAAVVVVIRQSMDINSLSPRGEEWLESGRNQGK